MSAIEAELNPATPAAPDPPTPAAPEPEKAESRRDTIVRAVAEAAKQQPRERGRFASPNPVETPTAAAPAFPVPAPSRPEMPKSLKPDYRTHWDAAHPDLLNDVVRREADFEKGVAPLKAAKAQYDEIMAEFAPYTEILAAEGATPKSAIAPLLRTAAIFRVGTPAQKAEAVRAIMGQYGVSLDQLQGLPGGGPPSANEDPRVQQLERQVHALTEQHRSLNESKAMEAIREFAASPENRHFEAVSERMSVLLRNPAVLGADVDAMSDRDKLRLAYDAAVRMIPEVHALALADKQASEAAKAQAEKSKAAAVQVKGAPAPGPQPKPDPGDRRALIASAFRAHR